MAMLGFKQTLHLITSSTDQVCQISVTVALTKAHQTVQPSMCPNNRILVCYMSTWNLSNSFCLSITSKTSQPLKQQYQAQAPDVPQSWFEYEIKPALTPTLAAEHPPDACRQVTKPDWFLIHGPCKNCERFCRFNSLSYFINTYVQSHKGKSLLSVGNPALVSYDLWKILLLQINSIHRAPYLAMVWRILRRQRPFAEIWPGLNWC